ncbi:site-specific DNA-methyltransferase, partial [Rhizobium ruizarguesonis]
LAKDGNIFVHCYWLVSGYMRIVLDDVFGTDNFRNEIIWKRRVVMSSAVHESNQYGVCTDTIFYSAESLLYCG